MAPWKSQLKEKSGYLAQGFALIVVLLAIGYVVQALQDLNKTPRQGADEAKSPQIDLLLTSACSAAQNAVTQRLRAPTNPTFPGCVLGIGEYEFRADKDQETMVVLGHVDSQNASGATIRTKFIVKLLRQQGGSNVPHWTVERVVIE